MIRVHIARDRDFGHPNSQHVDQGTTERTVFEALRRLVMAELRFGASVTHVAPTEIHLVTRMLGDRDTTEFSGSEEEMRPLLTAVEIYRRNCQPQLVVRTELIEMLERLPHGTAADRGFQQLVMPFATVENGLQLALLVPLGITDEEDLRVGASMRLDDVAAALELMQSVPGTAFRDVL
jgi:hypothetical protein